jgi:hypothetical protein
VVKNKEYNSRAGDGTPSPGVNQMKFFVVVAALFLVCVSASAAKPAPSCQDTCSATYSKPLRACHQVVECQEYVRHQYDICMQACN